MPHYNRFPVVNERTMNSKYLSVYSNVGRGVALHRTDWRRANVDNLWKKFNKYQHRIKSNQRIIFSMDHLSLESQSNATCPGNNFNCNEIKRNIAKRSKEITGAQHWRRRNKFSLSNHFVLDELTRESRLLVTVDRTIFARCYSRRAQKLKKSDWIGSNTFCSGLWERW